MNSFLSANTDILQKRRSILAYTIAEEETALLSGCFGPGSPKEVEKLEGENRTQRLIRWKEIMAALDRILAASNIDKPIPSAD